MSSTSKFTPPMWALWTCAALSLTTLLVAQHVPRVAVWLFAAAALPAAWAISQAAMHWAFRGLDPIRRKAGDAAADVPVRPPHEARLLAAVTYDGNTTTILAYAGDATRAEIDDAETVFVEDLGVTAPVGLGLHVWEGRIVHYHDDFTGEGHEPSWEGSWRRATPAEAQRYAAGLPVWEVS